MEFHASGMDKKRCLRCDSERVVQGRIGSREEVSFTTSFSLHGLCVPDVGSLCLECGLLTVDIDVGDGLFEKWSDQDRAIRDDPVVFQSFHPILGASPGDVETTTCGRCGNRSPEAATECPSCGLALQREDQTSAVEHPCPQCHEPVPDHFDVCWSCGAPTAGPDGVDQ